MTKQDAFLVDLDGTLALHRGVRNPYDWRRAGEDKPNKTVITVVRALHAYFTSIVYVSGRPESSRDITTRWLKEHVDVPGPLFLRADADQRKDAVIKREIFSRHIRPKYRVLGVLDDRQQVVDMWRNELGLTCLQVAPGDF